MADTTVDTELRVSPASHLADEMAALRVVAARGVELRERAFVGMVGIRARSGSATAAAIQRVLGTGLPARCGQVVATGDTAVLWLSPDEFLLVGPDAAESVPALAAAIEGLPGAVVDLSANRTTLELSGPSARDVLEKGCRLDLHPSATPPGTAWSTTLGPVPLIVHRITGDRFDLLPRASFADFTVRWLVDAAGEFAAA